MTVKLNLSMEVAKELRELLADRMEDYDDGVEMSKQEVGVVCHVSKLLDKAIARGMAEELNRQDRLKDAAVAAAALKPEA